MRDDSSSNRERGSAAGGALARDAFSVYCVAAAVVLTTTLTWGAVEIKAGDSHEALQSLGMTTKYSGVKHTSGKIALLAALAAGGLTWVDASGIVKWDRATTRVAALAAAVLALLAVVFGWIEVDHPFRTAFGLYVAMVAAAGLGWVTWARVAPLRGSAH